MLQLKDIKKDYVMGDFKVHALKGLSVEFRKSEFVSILGPSGCGKTTTLNIIGGLDRYSSGDLIIDNISTKDFKDRDWDDYRNKKIGFIFQSYNLISHLSILANVEIALTIAGVKKSERKEKAKKALEAVGLGEMLKKKPNQLSGGQMQRVAIARALVNDPEIILADEPTGALDSETSVQVMELLKKISKEKLIVMVTHNEELATNYSSRIVKMLDGLIIDDSNPYSSQNESVKEEVKKETSDKTIKPKKEKKSKMSVFTAMGLSFKNLISKKGRSILTSFAGSIGIIGIALVLAISNGFTAYVNNMQSTALSGYPIVIAQASMNMDAVENSFNSDGTKKPVLKDDELNVIDPAHQFGKLGHFNYLTQDYINYVENYYMEDQNKKPSKRNISAMQIQRASNYHIYTLKNDNVVPLDTKVSTSAISGMSTSIFFQGLKNSDYVLENYTEVLGHLPKNANEICLVIDSKNKFSKQDLEKLGLEYTQNGDVFSGLEYTKIIGKEYKLIKNNEYYIPDDITNPTKFDKAEITKELYNNPNNLTLKITGIIRAKEDSTTEIFNRGIMYHPDLEKEYIEDCKKSLIVKKTIENKKLYVPYVIDISEFNQINITGKPFTFNTPQEVILFAKSMYDLDLSLEQVLNLSLQMLDASPNPSAIYLYSNSFDSKKEILSYLEEWNKDIEKESSKIKHTDSTAFLTNTLGTLINTISYVLIAFSSISLLVSSIMIGIITYVSVIERTKEIGVLRSVGARKRDITRMFNSETFMLGLTSGLIGSLIAFILTLPINAIVGSLVADLSSIAILKFSQLSILTLISIFLSLISGLIPSFIAAKKDPVIALRTE